MGVSRPSYPFFPLEAPSYPSFPLQGIPFLSFLLLLLPTTPSAYELRVPPGTDGLPKALEWRRSLPDPLDEPVHIRLLPGVHRLSETLRLGPQDGGTADFQVSIEGEGNATVSGGVEVTGWRRSDADKLVWEADIPEGLNVSDIGHRMSLWRGTSRLTLARSPERRYRSCSRTWIQYEDGDILADYHDMENVLLVLYERWTASFNHILRLNTTNNTAFLTSGGFTPSDPDGGGSRFYVANALEELDEPGEFYVDRLGGRILLRVDSEDEDVSRGPPLTVALPTSLVLIEGEGADAPVQNVALRDVEFAHTAVESHGVLNGNAEQSGDFLEEAVLKVSFGAGIVVDHCTVRASGGYGLWVAPGSRRVRLANSYFHDLGAGGVRIGWAADEPKTEGVVIEGNILSDGGHVVQQGCGVLSQRAANVTVAHNEIRRFRYTGVSTGWTWGYTPTVVYGMEIAYNYIHDLGMGYLSDMGCVYALGHQPRSRVHHNVCADVQSYGYGGWGYYTDEGARDILFEDNVAVRTKCAGHFQHYGTDNVIRNSIFYQVDTGDLPTPGRAEIYMPGRCDGSIRSGQSHRNLFDCAHPDSDPRDGCCCHGGCDMAKCSSFSFQRNIVIQPEESNSSLIAPEWTHGFDNFTFDNNVYYSVGKTAESRLFNDSNAKGVPVNTSLAETLKTWQKNGKDTHSIFSDPLFTSVSGFNFTLDPKSPALALGFQPINLSTLGPQCMEECRGIGAHHALGDVSETIDRRQPSWFGAELHKLGLLV